MRLVVSQILVVLLYFTVVEVVDDFVCRKMDEFKKARSVKNGLATLLEKESNNVGCRWDEYSGKRSS